MRIKRYWLYLFELRSYHSISKLINLTCQKSISAYIYIYTTTHVLIMRVFLYSTHYFCNNCIREWLARITTWEQSHTKFIIFHIPVFSHIYICMYFRMISRDLANLSLKRSSRIGDVVVSSQICICIRYLSNYVHICCFSHSSNTTNVVALHKTFHTKTSSCIDYTHRLRHYVRSSRGAACIHCLCRRLQCPARVCVASFNFTRSARFIISSGHK